MTEKEFVSGVIGFALGCVVAGVFVGLMVDDGWRKYCVSKGAATYVQCPDKPDSFMWSWKD